MGGESIIDRELYRAINTKLHNLNSLLHNINTKFQNTKYSSYRKISFYIQVRGTQPDTQTLDKI